MLKKGGSVEHATGVQWFFKDEIRSHGWYTAELRKAVRSWRSAILKEHDFRLLFDVADKLFAGDVLEEKVAAVFLLEGLDANFSDATFVNSKRGSIGSAVGPITMRSYTT